MSYAQPVVDLGEMVLAFGRVDRITFHPDGEMLESDTDHTVMLGLIACAFAEVINRETKYFGRNPLTIGVVAQFALVHDLVEVYAGDTPTLKITKAGQAKKEVREHAAYERIAKEMTALPWLAATIEAYEAQVVREARFVKAMDKLMPKITHILNRCKTLHEMGVTRKQLDATYTQQRAKIEGYAFDFPIVLDLYDDLRELLCQAMT